MFLVCSPTRERSNDIGNLAQAVTLAMARHAMAWQRMEWHGMASHVIPWHKMPWHGIARHGMARHGKVSNGMPWHATLTDTVRAPQSKDLMVNT